MTASVTVLRVGLVAGELSGDRLGAGLMTALRERWPGAELRFVGVGGPRMLAAGLHPLASLERLSVMGLVEPLRRLPELVALRRRLRRELLATPVDLFVGIDAPDFNLGLARRLRDRGVKTAHYVSPQVWAWRRWRAKKIARSIDLMLTLFPFELDFYTACGIPARCVGHPLADAIPLTSDPAAARAALNLAPTGDGPLLALLPGSRAQEVARHGPLFAAAARELCRALPDARVAVAAASPAIAQRLQQQGVVGDGVALIVGRTRELIQACDLALAASGTVTLEVLLHDKPMVVVYQVAPLSAWLARRLVKVEYFALPNLLAGERLVSELFQEQADAGRLADELLALWQDPERRRRLSERFGAIHRELRRGASRRAAAALATLVTPC